MRYALPFAAVALPVIAAAMLYAGAAPAPAEAPPADLIEADAAAEVYAPDPSGPWLLIVDRQGAPGESDVADYDLTLGDCLDAMRAQPREANAACERDRG